MASNFDLPVPIDLPLITLICKQCGETYSRPYKTTYCGLSCSARATAIGRVRSKETKEKMSKKRKEYFNNPENRKRASEQMKQRYKNPDYRANIKDKCKERWETGGFDEVSFGYGKQGIREDLNQFFRSNWEANVARTLNLEGIKWEYELELLELKELETSRQKVLK